MHGKKEQEEYIRKGQWEAEEDEVLLNHVKKYGPRDWSSIRSKGLLQRASRVIFVASISFDQISRSESMFSLHFSPHFDCACAYISMHVCMFNCYLLALVFVQ